MPDNQHDGRHEGGGSDADVRNQDGKSGKTAGNAFERVQPVLFVPGKR